MKQISIYMAVIAMLVLSCNTANHKTEEKEKNKIALDMARTKFEPVPDQAIAAADTALGNGQASAGNEITRRSKNKAATYEDWDKKIIKTAEVSLELIDYAAYNQNLHKGLRSYGAYIASEEQNSTDERAANNMVIKVPVDQFENLMNSFSGDGIKVLQKKISSEDVTGEMVDTRSRMQAKKQMRDRYLELLKQARNMKEILEVQQEINSIQEQMESAAGRINYLGHQSAYSTIHLQYFQYLVAAPAHEPNSYLLKLKEGFYVGIHAIGNILLFIVTLWPWILLGTVAVFIWKRKKTGMV